ncbi:Coiled-coil domain-containing protein [Phytophthora cactorum]|nr:Coiled-coil domain-containing protein [Phytophthora cactorum]
MGKKQGGANTKVEAAKAKKATAKAAKDAVKAATDAAAESAEWAKGSDTRAEKRRQEEERKRAEQEARRPRSRNYWRWRSTHWTRISTPSASRRKRSRRRPSPGRTPSNPRSRRTTVGPRSPRPLQHFRPTGVAVGRLRRLRWWRSERPRRPARPASLVRKPSSSRTTSKPTETESGRPPDARSLDAALDLLSVGDKELEKHPERRAKAAYKAFEEVMMPQVKEDYPGLKLSQYKQKLSEMWRRSPDNPLNQESLAYNAKKQ